MIFAVFPCRHYDYPHVGMIIATVIYDHASKQKNILLKQAEEKKNGK